MAVAPGILAAISLGGMLGAAARYWVAEVLRPTTGELPWATFVVNLVGSFVLGALVVVLEARDPLPRKLLAFSATGMLGSFTTFSAMVVESELLAADGRAAVAIGYPVFSLAAGVVAALAGVVLARRFEGRLA